MTWKSWLAVRPESLDDHVFLNRDGQPLGERGVRKLVAKYLRLADITKKVSCHNLEAHVCKLQGRARGQPVPAQGLARTRLDRDYPDLRPYGAGERPQGDGGNEPTSPVGAAASSGVGRGARIYDRPASLLPAGLAPGRLAPP
jgi:hypothetical protein